MKMHIAQIYQKCIDLQLFQKADTQNNLYMLVSNNNNYNVVVYTFFQLIEVFFVAVEISVYTSPMLTIMLPVRVREL